MFVNICYGEHGYEGSDVGFDVMNELEWGGNNTPACDREIIAYFHCSFDGVEPELEGRSDDFNHPCAIRTTERQFLSTKLF